MLRGLLGVSGLLEIVRYGPTYLLVVFSKRFNNAHQTGEGGGLLDFYFLQQW
jgi:hypothetical protein